MTAQAMRQMHQNGGGRAPDVVVRMRPDPELPHPAAKVGAPALGRIGTESGRVKIASTSASDGVSARPSGSRDSTGEIRKPEPVR